MTPPDSGCCRNLPFSVQPHRWNFSSSQDAGIPIRPVAKACDEMARRATKVRERTMTAPASGCCRNLLFSIHPHKTALAYMPNTADLGTLISDCSAWNLKTGDQGMREP